MLVAINLIGRTYAFVFLLNRSTIGEMIILYTNRVYKQLTMPWAPVNCIQLF